MSDGSPTLIGLPYDASSSFLRGAAAAPPSLRLALRSGGGNSFSEELRDLSAEGVLLDMGDLALPESPDAFALIESALDDLLASGRRPLSLGGDHSVTLPIVRAVRRVLPSNSSYKSGWASICSNVNDGSTRRTARTMGNVTE